MFGAAFALIGQFLGSKLGPPMFLVIGAAAALGWGLWYMEAKAHDQTIKNNATQIATLEGSVKALDQALIDQKKSYAALVQEQQAQRLARVKLDFEYAAITKERDEAVNKLQSYRSRWSNVANKKPELLSRIINRATNKRVHSFNSGTCRSGCDTDRDTSSSGGASTEAGPDREG